MRGVPDELLRRMRDGMVELLSRRVGGHLHNTLGELADKVGTVAPGGFGGADERGHRLVEGHGREVDRLTAGENRGGDLHLAAQERPPFLYIPKDGDKWPDRIQRIGDTEYKVLGGGIYVPADATSGEVKKLYEYWVEHHDYPYDVQHEWIPTIGRNCADLIKYSGRDLSRGSLLDLASGTGLVSKGIREKVDIGGLHVCLDLTEATLRSARSKSELTGANLVNGNAVSLPFREGTFDVVTGSLFLGHIPERQWSDLFSNIERVLKPDGIFIMTSSPNEKLGVTEYLSGAFGDAPTVQQLSHRSANAPDGFPLDYHVSVKQRRADVGRLDDGTADTESTH